MDLIVEFFKDWSKSEIFGLLALAAPLLMFVGGVADRLLLWCYEWWTSVKCFGQVEEVRAFNKTRNDRGQIVTMQVINANTKEVKNHHTDRYTDDTETVRIRLQLRYFNTKSKNVGLQEIQLVLLKRKFPFRKEILGKFRLEDEDTAKASGKTRSIDEIGPLTLLPRVWNSSNCISEKIPIEMFLDSEQIWAFARDENQRHWKRELQDTPAIKKER